MKTPTEEQVKKWAKEAYGNLIKEIGTEENVRQEVALQLNKRALKTIILTVMGFEFDSWNQIRPAYDLDKTQLYKITEPLIKRAYAKALEGYKLELTPKEITVIRAAYKRAYVEQLKQAAAHRGEIAASEHLDTIIRTALEEEE